MPEGNPDLERISGSEPLPASLEPVRPRIPRAWDPIRPRGVAAFALARWGRLLTVALLVALLCAGTVVWFINWAWTPILAAATSGLPDTGYIEDQQLQTPHDSTEPLAINPFLGIGVDPEARSNANVGTDVYVKFHRREVLFCSFLGCMAVPYPKGWTIEFNRPELAPWWGAWKLMIFSLAFLALVIYFMGIWLLLGLIYAPIVWLVARHHQHKLPSAACWRLATACNFPGALFFVLAIVGYGLGLLSLIPFCVAGVAHFIPAWIYLFICPKHIPVTPRPAESKAANPFNAARPNRGFSRH